MFIYEQSIQPPPVGNLEKNSSPPYRVSQYGLVIQWIAKPELIRRRPQSVHPEFEQELPYKNDEWLCRE